MAITLDGTNGVTTPDLTVDTTTLTVDTSNNRVGIGTTSPPDHLSVVTSGANAQLSVDRSDGASGRTVLIHSGTGGQLQTTGSVPLIFGTADLERMRIDSSGRVTMPNQPAFMAFKVGNFSVGTTTVQVTGWNNNLDIGSNWDNSQNRYTVPTAGIYLAGGFYQCNQSTGLHFGIYKNGAAYGNDSLLDMVAGGANGYSVPFSMAAGDYFTWVAYTSVSALINANRSKIWVIKVA